MNETFTPAQAASILETDASTVRRWCGWHAAHLSDSATPASGGRRKLTARDLEVLREVKALRIAGLSTQAANRTFAVPDSTELAQTAQNAPGSELAPIVAVDALATFTAPFVARMEAIERTHAADAQARRHWLYAFALGALCMAVLILIVLGLYWLGG